MIIRNFINYLHFRRLNDAQTRTRKSLGDNTENTSSDGGISPQLPRSQSGISVKSRRSIPSQKSASRTSVDEPTCIAAELHDLPEGSESGDSETATEVDVSLKYLYLIFIYISVKVREALISGEETLETPDHTKGLYK